MTTTTCTAPVVATITITITITDAAPCRACASPPAGEASLLKLIWLASPALPAGAFSYSEVLEAAIDAGQVADEAGATRWLLDQLALIQSRAELPAMAAAMRAWARGDLARIDELNHWVLKTRESFELRRQTEQMGHSMAAWCRECAPGDARAAGLAALEPAPSWPAHLAGPRT